MVAPRTWGRAAATMMAFAAKPLPCREALRHTAIHPASLTPVRILVLALAMAAVRRR